MNRKVVPQRNDTRLLIGNGKNTHKHFMAKCSKDEGNAPHQKGGYPNALLNGKEVKQLKILQRCPSAMQAAAMQSNVGHNMVQRSHNANPPGIICLRRGQEAPLQLHSAKQPPKTRNNKEAELASSRQDIRLEKAAANQPPWFAKLRSMEDGAKLAGLLQQISAFRGEQLIARWHEFYECHNGIQLIFRKYLRFYMDFCIENLVDNFFWKLLVYNVRAQLRSIKSAEATQHLHTLIQHSIDFYKCLVDDLYGLCDLTPGAFKKNPATTIAHRLMIRLGDLYRYQSHQERRHDYAMAAQYYKKALHLQPTNGSPYNQLAVISTQKRQHFDAIYYYMRSLYASHPIQSARESLLDLFDDARKEFEQSLKSSAKSQESGRKSEDNMRTVVWITPADDEIRAAKVDQIPASDMPEMRKEVSSLYLYLSGKIYLGIGMENFYEHLKTFRDKLFASLETGRILADNRLFRMFIINICIIEQNKQSGRRELRYHAFNFCNTIFGMLLKKLNILLNVQSIKEMADKEDANYLSTALQCVHIYLLWLKHNLDVWEPVRQEQHCLIHCWKELNAFLAVLQSVKANHLNSLCLENICTLFANEDNLLDGFEPLRKLKSETLQQSLVNSILEFREVYKAHKHSLLNSDDYLNMDQDDLLELIDELELKSDENLNSLPLSVDIESPSDDQSKENYLPSLVRSARLIKLKQQLDARNEIHEMCNRKFQEILSHADEKIHIEVRPRYLLPDTNCFIDCLEDLHRLAKDSRYILVVPLTVVKELDGLSKGVKLIGSAFRTKRIHHFDEVSSVAEAALNFIKSSRDYVQCKTSKGSRVSPTLFELEEAESASNDDKILKTAVAISKRHTKEERAGNTLTIKTDLVLLTTDRNLRVKALTRNLIVCAMEDFLNWTKKANKS